MYHRNEAEFIPVATELREDFNRVCGILQGFWTDIEQESKKILENNKYLERRRLGTAITPTVYSPFGASATANVALIGAQGSWWK